MRREEVGVANAKFNLRKTAAEGSKEMKLQGNYIKGSFLGILL